MELVARTGMSMTVKIILFILVASLMGLTLLLLQQGMIPNIKAPLQGLLDHGEDEVSGSTDGQPTGNLDDAVGSEYSGDTGDSGTTDNESGDTTE
jgi:hypothetical protein